MSSRDSSNETEYADIVPLLLWGPEGFEESLGYDQRRRFVAFFWDPEWNDLAINDGYRQSIGPQWRSADGSEGDAWDDWRSQKMVENILAGYDLGENGSKAAHWLILDRQNRRFSIAPAERAAHFLRDSNSPIGDFESAPSDTQASPYPSEPLQTRKWDEYTI